MLCASGGRLREWAGVGSLDCGSGRLAAGTWVGRAGNFETEV